MISKPVSAQILLKGAQHIEDRAATRDKKQGDGKPAIKSMARTVHAFSALTGVTLSEEQGWMFMVMLKMSRASAGQFNMDDYEDGAAYFALAGEAAQEHAQLCAQNAQD